MVDELLGARQWRLQDLDAIAFGRGPGGFTGVRLAASIAQGLAFGAGLRVVPISNLAALAALAFEAHPQATRCWVGADARMQELYCGLFGRQGPRGVALLGAERVLKLAAVAASVEQLGVPPERCIAVGRGLRAYPSAAADVAKHCGAFLPDALPTARHIAELALIEWAAGRSVTPEDAIPVYLRDEVAHRPVTPVQ
jgi:tRNA threonylcarbamoyladenosine biosynthesis protein TsaB